MKSYKSILFTRTTAFIMLWIFLFSNVSFALRPQPVKDRIPVPAKKSAAAGQLRIIVQSGAGAHCGFRDEDYRKAGAEIVPAAAEVWKRSHLILKVKEPEDEYARESEGVKSMPQADKNELVIGVPTETRPGEGRVAITPDGVRDLIEYARENGCYVGAGQPQQVVFPYWHVSAMRKTADLIRATGVTAIGLEGLDGDPKKSPLYATAAYVDSTGGPGRILVPGIVRDVKLRQGPSHVCLEPMSIVAGLQAPLQGIIFLDEERVKIDGNEVITDEAWANDILAQYPDSPIPNPLKDKTMFITGAGAAGLSALWQGERLGARVVITDVKDKMGIIGGMLREHYGEKAAICRTIDQLINALRDPAKTIILMEASTDKETYEQSIMPAMAVSSIIVGTAHEPNARAPITISAELIKKVTDEYPMRRLIVDPAKDQGGNSEVVTVTGEVMADVPYTIHEAPVMVGYKGLVIYYLVANMPGRPLVPGQPADPLNPAPIARGASLALWETRKPFVEQLITLGLLGAARENPGLAAGVLAVDGQNTNAEIARTFPDLGCIPVDDALAAKAARQAFEMLPAAVRTNGAMAVIALSKQAGAAKSLGEERFTSEEFAAARDIVRGKYTWLGISETLGEQDLQTLTADDGVKGVPAAILSYDAGAHTYGLTFDGTNVIEDLQVVLTRRIATSTRAEIAAARKTILANRELYQEVPRGTKMDQVVGILTDYATGAIQSEQDVNKALEGLGLPADARRRLLNVAWLAMTPVPAQREPLAAKSGAPVEIEIDDKKIGEIPLGDGRYYMYASIDGEKVSVLVCRIDSDTPRHEAPVSRRTDLSKVGDAVSSYGDEITVTLAKKVESGKATLRISGPGLTEKVPPASETPYPTYSSSEPAPVAQAEARYLQAARLKAFDDYTGPAETKEITRKDIGDIPVGTGRYFLHVSMYEDGVTVNINRREPGTALPVPVSSLVRLADKGDALASMGGEIKVELAESVQPGKAILRISGPGLTEEIPPSLEPLYRPYSSPKPDVALLGAI